MVKKNEKNSQSDDVVKLERIEGSTGKKNISEGFYYLLGSVISLVLMFATEELLSTINYLFVLIFAVISIIQIGLFMWNKDYDKKNYTGLIVGISSIWIAIFIYKYGEFLFMEMLPVVSSLLLFILGISSLSKYLDNKKIGNGIISIVSFILGLTLMFVPKDVMYIFFKISGCYILILIMLDFIDYIRNKK